MTSPPGFFKDGALLLLGRHEVLKQREIAARPPCLQARVADASLAPAESHLSAWDEALLGTEERKRGSRRRSPTHQPCHPNRALQQLWEEAVPWGGGLPSKKTCPCPCPFQPCCQAITATKAGCGTRSPDLAALCFTGIFSLLNTSFTLKIWKSPASSTHLQEQSVPGSSQTRCEKHFYWRAHSTEVSTCQQRE